MHNLRIVASKYYDCIVFIYSLDPQLGDYFGEGRECVNCGVVSTPMWRRDGTGK